MKVAINVFMDMMLILLLVASVTYYTGSALVTVGARNYLSTTMDAIAASAGSNAVIEERIATATTQGFKLKVTPTKLYEDKSYYYVELTYVYAVPFVGGVGERVIDGYTR